MASLQDIRRRITSVKNTKQITRAMKLVSAAKLRKAQDAATQGRAFAANLESVTKRLIIAAADKLNNPLLKERAEVKTRRVIIVGGDRGLCGPYNTNLAKVITAKEQDSDSNVKREFVCFGRRVVSLGKTLGLNVIENHEGLSEDISTWPLGDVINQSIADFIDGNCDEVVIYFTKFVTAMNQQVTETPLLPFSTKKFESEGTSSEGEAEDLIQMKFDPSPEKILENIIPLYLQTMLAQACFESKASEHAARMTAMDAATRNADELNDRLVLTYNRARQSAITTELLDILGGAEAVSS